MFLSKISIHSGGMILYSMEKSIFVVVLYKLLVKMKYKKHIACSYDCQLVCVDDRFSKLPKTFLGKDSLYNFINSMIKNGKYFVREKSSLKLFQTLTCTYSFKKVQELGYLIFLINIRKTTINLIIRKKIKNIFHT